MFAASTPSFETLDKVLREMYGIAKKELIGILQSAHAENKSKGYKGPFCSLQLDLTSKSNLEYIAASVKLIRFVVLSLLSDIFDAGCFILNKVLVCVFFCFPLV